MCTAAQERNLKGFPKVHVADIDIAGGPVIQALLQYSRYSSDIECPRSNVRLRWS